MNWKKYIFTVKLFVTREQKVNNTMKHTVKGWEESRRKVKKVIDKNMKLLFIQHAQEETMTVNHSGVKTLIVNYNKISTSFQDDGTRPNYNKMFQVTTGQFN